MCDYDDSVNVQRDRCYSDAEAIVEDSHVEAQTELVPESTAHDRASYFTSYVFCVNFILGTGVVAVPYAFYKAGIVFALIFTAFLTMMAFMTAFFILEAQSRLTMIQKAYRFGWIKPIIGDSDSVVNAATGSDNDEHGPRSRLLSVASNRSLFGSRFVKTEEAFSLEPTSSMPKMEEMPSDMGEIPRERIKELRELCQVYIGNAGTRCWDIILTIYLLVILWLYVAVWSEALLLLVPIPNMTKHLECDSAKAGGLSEHCHTALRLWMVFGLFVLGGLAIPDIKAMDRIQTFLTIVSYISISVMLITCGAAMHSMPYPDAKVISNATAPYIQKVPLFKAENFSYLFGTMIFSQMMHMGIPGFFRVMPSMKKAKTVFSAAFTTTYVIYSLLGVITSLYFGDAIENTVTLNWQHYHDWGVRNGFGVFVSWMIVGFPLITITAGYVLSHRPVGSGVEQMMPLKWRVALCAKLGREYDPTKYTIIRFLCRSSTVLISIVLGIITYDVSTIIAVAGLLGFFMMFFYPVAFQVMSMRYVKALGLPEKTPYHTPILSSMACAYTVGGIAVLGWLYYAYSQIVVKYIIH